MVVVVAAVDRNHIAAVNDNEPFAKDRTAYRPTASQRPNNNNNIALNKK